MDIEKSNNILQGPINNLPPELFTSILGNSEEISSAVSRNAVNYNISDLDFIENIHKQQVHLMLLPEVCLVHYLNLMY